MEEKVYRFRHGTLVIEGTKEQILALYETIHYEESVPSYLNDIFSDIEIEFPDETGVA